MPVGDLCNENDRINIQNAGVPKINRLNRSDSKHPIMINFESVKLPQIQSDSHYIDSSVKKVKYHYDVNEVVTVTNDYRIESIPTFGKT